MQNAQGCVRQLTCTDCAWLCARAVRRPRRGGTCVTALLVLGLALALAYQALQWRPDLAEQLAHALAPVLEHEQVAPLVAAATPAASVANAAVQHAMGRIAAGAQQALQWARDEL